MTYKLNLKGVKTLKTKGNLEPLVHVRTDFWLRVQEENGETTFKDTFCEIPHNLC